MFVIFTHKNGCHSLYKKVSSELSTALHKQFSRKKKKKKIVEIPSKQSKQNDDNVVIAGTLHFIAVVVVE